MSRYKDFDAAWAEKKQEAIKFRAFGQEYERPASLPAESMVETLRLKKQYGEDGNIPEPELMRLAVTLIGEEQLADLCSRGMAIDQLGDLVQWLFMCYMGGDDEGNSKAPVTGQKSTSSKTGRTSKRTSKGNTA